MAMSQKYIEAIRAFRNQTAEVDLSQGGFKRAYITPGTHVCRITSCKVIDRNIGDEKDIPCWESRMKVDRGGDSGKVISPLPPRLDEYDNVVQVVRSVSRVLGEGAIPTRVNPKTNKAEVALDLFLQSLEELSKGIEGMLVEVFVQDNKQGKTDKDGLVYQNYYFNGPANEPTTRVLGPKTNKLDPDDDLDMGVKKPEKKVAKRK